jgi:hypothetical protein
MLELSDTTKAYLDGICFASNFFWTEGGMSYEVLTSPDSVDCKAEDREKIHSENALDFYAEPHSQLAKLSWFLHSAFGGRWDVELKKQLPISTVSETFLSRLNADIHANWFTNELEEDEYGMDNRQTLVSEGNLAAAYSNLGRSTEALEIRNFEIVLDRWPRKTGNKMPSPVKTLEYLVDLLKETGNADKSKMYQEQLDEMKALNSPKR